MKSIVYVHDLMFLRDGHSNYSSTGMPEIYFDRFFDSGISEVNIVSRSKQHTNNNSKGYSCFVNKKLRVFNGCASSYIGLANPIYIIRLFKLIKQNDLIVANIPSITGMFVLLLNLFLKKPYSVEVAADYDQFSSKRFGRIVSFFMKPLMKFFVRNSVGAAFVSNYLKDKYITDTRRVVASNVNLKSVCPKVIKATPFNMNDTIVITFVGGLNSRKGLDVLFESVKALIHGGFSKLTIEVIGGHQDRNWLKVVRDLGIESNVHFHGLCDRQYIESILRKSDLYVQPSITEGIPRATLEAMSFSLPVIATELPGFQEILDPDVLVPVGEAIALSEKIRYLLTDITVYNAQMSINERTSKSFVYSILHSKRVSFYESILLDLG